jgi:hypothetical protein
MKIKSITNKNSVSGSDFSDKVIKNTRLEIVSNDKNISEAVDTPSSITPKTIFVKTNSGWMPTISFLLKHLPTILQCILQLKDTSYILP